MKLGKKTFFKDEPVIYFDTLTTSSLEGAVTTVYAQGGKGNSRLMAWDGERTVTFNMEDALISPEGIAILTGAGLIDASKKETVKYHKTENVKVTVTGSSTSKVVTAVVESKPYVAEASGTTDTVYVFPLDKNGNITTEPYIPTSIAEISSGDDKGKYKLTLSAAGGNYSDGALDTFITSDGYAIVDYYVEYASDAMQINITADQFGSNFYIEASTLFKDEQGTDHEAQFIIPNGKVQSNFTFSLAASGDPSTFAFTVDAFPDYLRFDQSTKVLSAIQVLNASTQSDINYVRDMTVSDGTGKTDKTDTVKVDPNTYTAPTEG